MATCGNFAIRTCAPLRLDASEPDALAFIPDGRWLAVSFWNRKAIQVWTADGSRKVFTLELAVPFTVSASVTMVDCSRRAETMA